MLQIGEGDVTKYRQKLTSKEKKESTEMINQHKTY